MLVVETSPHARAPPFLTSPSPRVETGPGLQVPSFITEGEKSASTPQKARTRNAHSAAQVSSSLLGRVVSSSANTVLKSKIKRSFSIHHNRGSPARSFPHPTTLAQSIAMTHVGIDCSGVPAGHDFLDHFRVKARHAGHEASARRRISSALGAAWKRGYSVPVLHNRLRNVFSRTR